MNRFSYCHIDIAKNQDKWKKLFNINDTVLINEMFKFLNTFNENMCKVGIKYKPFKKYIKGKTYFVVLIVKFNSMNGSLMLDIDSVGKRSMYKETDQEYEEQRINLETLGVETPKVKNNYRHRKYRK